MIPCKNIKHSLLLKSQFLWGICEERGGFLLSGARVHLSDPCAVQRWGTVRPGFDVAGSRALTSHSTLGSTSPQRRTHDCRHHPKKLEPADSRSAMAGNISRDRSWGDGVQASLSTCGDMSPLQSQGQLLGFHEGGDQASSSLAAVKSQMPPTATPAGKMSSAIESFFLVAVSQEPTEGEVKS